jgi:carboxylesterase type B
MAGGAYDQPPFRGAVAEYPWWQPLLNDSSQELQLFNVLNLAKCNDLNCLRGMTSAQLQQVATQSYITGYDQPAYGYGVFYYGPVVDGKFLIELPDQAFKHGRFYNVPLIVDRDGYEGVDFSNKSQTNQVEETSDAEILFPDAGARTLFAMGANDRSLLLLSFV